MYTEQTTLLLDPPISVSDKIDHLSDTRSTEPWLSLVDHAVATMHAPLDPYENDRYHQFLGDLVRGDGDAAADRLDGPNDGFGGAYALLPCYVAAIQSIIEITASGYVLPGSDHLLRVIRHQTRGELARLPSQGTVEWIVPLTPLDRTAAHVAALVFTRLGMLSRPWLWDSIPDHGRFIILGVNARMHHAAENHRCEGCLTFTEVAERFTHQC